MKNNLLLVLIFLISFSSYAQIRFESGYIIDNSGNQKEVLIKNVDWRSNPTLIEYKSSEASGTETASVNDIREFGIGESVKYVRHTVQMDQSSDNISSLSRTRSPEFKEETLFLKMLIEGQADLYLFKDDSRSRFLYAVNDTPVEQLVYKQFQSGTGNERGRNNQFRQQILNNLSCQALDLRDVERLKYSEKDLRTYFIEYHECVGADYVEFGIPSGGENGNFSVKIKGGLNVHTVKLERVGSLFTLQNVIEIDSDPSPRIGVELEYSLPFNKNKWSVISDISFYQVKGEQEYQFLHYDPNSLTTFQLDYTVLSIPVGIRHYFFLNDSSAIYANGAYEFSSYVSGSIEDSERGFENEIELGTVAHTFQLGVGYSWKNKISAEVQYSLPQDYLAEHSGENSSNISKWEGSSSYLSILLSYKIF